SASATSTTGGGRRARPDRAGRTRSCTTRRARASAAASPRIPRAAPAAASSSGIWCSCSTSRTRSAGERSCPRRTSTRAWAWDGLRRIVRRATRYGRRLGIEQAFLGSIVEAVIDRMGGHYPELLEGRQRIRSTIEDEEEAFSRTLRAGTAQLERLVAEAKAR